MMIVKWESESFRAMTSSIFGWKAVCSLSEIWLRIVLKTLRVRANIFVRRNEMLSQFPGLRKMAEEESKENALQANIKAKGDQSYYYAHARKYEEDESAIKLEGDGIITGGPPVLIHRSDSSVFAGMRSEKITRYSWFDDGPKVKLILEFDFEVLGDMIKIDFDTTSCRLNV
jgi:hypothetical protein